MTVRELAEKIGNTFLEKMPKGVFEVPGSHMAFVVWLESLLSVALAEAVDSGFICGKDSATPIHCCVSDICDLLPEKLKEARAEAFEEAAKMAEEMNTEGFSGYTARKMLAVLLRRRAGEGK